MLVQNSVYRNTYLTDGVNKDFYFSFPILESSQVLVQTSLLTNTDVVTTIDPSQYTVTGVGLTTGGHISFTTAPPTGSRIALTLNIPITQLYQYAELDSFPAKSHENALAKLTLICQQLREQLERAVMLPSTSSDSPETVIASIYASRDAAAVSASAASNKADAAEVSAQAAANSASAATEQANNAHESALAAAQSAAEAAATPATTTSRGVARVATLADALPESTISNGPAFLDAATVKITPTPTAHAVPQADGSGKIDGWVTPTAILNASTLLTSSGTHTPTKTRLARITIKGGAGGGAGGTGYETTGASGPGGGEAETVTFWALLIAGTAYSYTIGAGGLAGAANADGGNGGTTTWGSHTAQGGFGGIHASGPGNTAFTGGRGGKGGGTGLTKGEDGQAAAIGWSNTASGGKGGGKNGGRGALTEASGQSAEAGTLGCGGGGGDWYRSKVGANGGNGFVLIEFYDDSIVMN